jgi:hypothetical protein
MSAGGFLSGSSSKCPGFPSGFSSGGIFDGSGTATANALGGGSTSSRDDHDTLITGPGRFNIIQGASGGETLVVRN